MKIKPDKIKESSFHKAASRLPRLIETFETGDFEHIGKMCLSVCTIDEFLGRSTRRLKSPHEPLIAAYRENVYSRMVALVLHDGSNAFKYSRSYVIKFLRGEYLHGDSDNRDEKRMTLHNFVFEEDSRISLEYAVTWSFVIFPGMYASSGNTDSGTPFMQDVKFHDREIEITQIESIALNTAIEYWEILNGRLMPWQKLAVLNDLDAFVGKLGREIVTALKADWAVMKQWHKEKRMSL